MTVTRVRALVALAGLLALALSAGSLAPHESDASSHREAFAIMADPQVDNTDVYVFRSPDAPNTVTIISNWFPFEEPAGGPNFYSFDKNARYNIHIDNNGDGKPNITYTFDFADHYRDRNTFLYNTGPVTSLEDPDLNFFQSYDVIEIKKGKSKRLLNDAIAMPSLVGENSMPDPGVLRSEAVRAFGGSKAFAGQADDPFYADLRVFDLLYGADLSEVGDDTLAGFNVNTIALQIPRGKLAKDKTNPIIGVWSTASRPQKCVLHPDKPPTCEGKHQQLSRLGMPLVNEVVIPVEDKDFWNTSKPVNDLANFAQYIQDPELPKLMEAIYGIPAPATPREDLVAVFATGVDGLNQPPSVVPSEMIRLNMSTDPCEPGVCATYSRLGVIGGDVAGYPNGRRLADDAIDISLQVMEGELVGSPNDLGDGVDGNDLVFTPTFPYVAVPHSGSDRSPH